MIWFYRRPLTKYVRKTWSAMQQSSTTSSSSSSTTSLSNRKTFGNDEITSATLKSHSTTHVDMAAIRQARIKQYANLNKIIDINNTTNNESSVISNVTDTVTDTDMDQDNDLQ